jgi:hypothetical protein
MRQAIHGSAHPSPDSDAMVSLKQTSDHTWEYTDAKSTKSVATATVVGDRLTWDSVSNLPNGSSFKSSLALHRIGTGKGLIGDWVYTNDSYKNQGDPYEMIVEAFGTSGLSLISPSDKSRTDMQFDGKDYPDHGPNVDKGGTTSGKRIDERTLQLISRRRGKLVGKAEWKISADGQTLMDTDYPAKGGDPTINVFDRK